MHGLEPDAQDIESKKLFDAHLEDLRQELAAVEADREEVREFEDDESEKKYLFKEGCVRGGEIDGDKPYSEDASGEDAEGFSAIREERSDSMGSIGQESRKKLNWWGFREKDWDFLPPAQESLTEYDPVREQLFVDKMMEHEKEVENADYGESFATS